MEDKVLIQDAYGPDGMMIEMDKGGYFCTGCEGRWSHEGMEKHDLSPSRLIRLHDCEKYMTIPAVDYSITLEQQMDAAFGGLDGERCCWPHIQMADDIVVLGDRIKAQEIEIAALKRR